MGAEGGNGGGLRFAQGVEGTRQEHGDGAGGGHERGIGGGCVFEMVGGKCARAGRKGGAAGMGELFGMELDREVQRLCRGEDLRDLIGGEGDGFAEGVDLVDQPLGGEAVQGGQADLVEIGLGAALVIGRDGMGAKEGGDDAHGAQTGQPPRRKEHPAFGIEVETVAGLDLDRPDAFGKERIKAGKGRDDEVVDGCRPGGGEGREDAAPGGGDGGIALTLEPHGEFRGAVAGMDDMGVTIDQRGRDKPAALIAQRARCGQVGAGAAPADEAVGDDDGRIFDQRRLAGVAGGKAEIGEDHDGRLASGQRCGRNMSAHIRGVKVTKLWAERALLPDGWARDVAVTVGPDGRIARVEAGAAAGCERRAVLLPAPANLHSHAFQRAMAGLTEARGPDPRDTFWTWRRLMFRYLEEMKPEQVEAIAAFVQMEMLEAGYACNVEFHYLHHQPDGTPYADTAEMVARIGAAAAVTGIGLTLLPVHYQFGGCDGRPLAPGQVRFGTTPEAYLRLWEASARALAGLPGDRVLGRAPHSLRAVSVAGLRAVTEGFHGPLHMHLAEQVAEVEEVSAALGARPVAWALDHLPLGPRWCLIHLTQMEPAETRRLAPTGVVAGLCPITEANLGDGIFDGVRWLAAGGRIGVGSDSNIRISLTEELRQLDHSQRLRDRVRAALATPEQSTGRRLYDAVLAGGAQAAGRAAGAIAPGMWADLLALDMRAVDLEGREGDRLLDAWIFAGSDRMVSDVWAAGRHVVHEGRHVARDAVEAGYRRVMRELRDRL